MIKCLPYSEHLVKISPVDQWILRQLVRKVSFKERNGRFYTIAIRKLQSYWITAHQITKNVTRLKIKLLKSEQQYSKPNWYVKATNEIQSADFANFDPKISCHGNNPRTTVIGVKSVIYNQIPTIW